MEAIARILDLVLPSTPVALGALGFLLAVVWTHRNRALGASKCDLPGPSGWPLIGNLPMLVRNSPRMLEHDLMMRKKHGPVRADEARGRAEIAGLHIVRARLFCATRLSCAVPSRVCA